MVRKQQEKARSASTGWVCWCSLLPPPPQLAVTQTSSGSNNNSLETSVIMLWHKHQSLLFISPDQPNQTAQTSAPQIPTYLSL